MRTSKSWQTHPQTTAESARLDLILMYAGNHATAPRALNLAEQEMRNRQDVWTLDAYAWALYANARYRDANAALQKAIAIGIQSSQIFDHAGHVAQRLNLTADAARYFQLSVQTNPLSDPTAQMLACSSAPVRSHALWQMMIIGSQLAQSSRRRQRKRLPLSSLSPCRVNQYQATRSQ